MKKWIFLPAVFLVLFGSSVHALQRISEKPDGTGGNGRSWGPSISGDGSAIVFASYATNLVEDETDYPYNVFLWRRVTDDLILLTRDISEQILISGTMPAISANGRYIVYLETRLVYPGPVNTNSLVIHDRDDDGDGIMDEPGAVGRVVTPLTNLNDLHITSRLNISGDGRFVAYVRETARLQNPDGLTDLELAPFLWNRDANAITEITAILRQISVATIRDPSGAVGYTSFLEITDIDANGRYILFDRRGLASQLSEFSQVYVYDRFLERTTLISKTAHGDPADRGGRSAAMSGDGRFVVFNSTSSNLPNNPFSIGSTYLADRDADENGVLDDTPENIPSLLLVSVDSQGRQIGTVFPIVGDVSLDGKRVLFEANSNQIYLRDINRGTTTLLSIGTNGAPGNGQSYRGAISESGAFVTFDSLASDLVPNDTEGFSDVFDLQTQQPIHTACEASRCAELPGDGPLLCFSDRDCTPMHTECTRSGECVEIPGEGANTCQASTDCPVVPAQHLACVNQACILVNGSGTGTCFSNSDCVEHTTCTRDGLCISIPGSANNSCTTHADCVGHFVCTQEQTCASVAGSGENSCSTNADCSLSPPPTGHLYSCTDSDEGDRPTRFGTAKTLQDGSRPVAWNWDFCCQDFLKEFYCVDAGIQSRWYYCKNCVEGKCLDVAEATSENSVPQLCKDLPRLYPSGERSLKKTLQRYYQEWMNRIRGLFR